MSAEKNTTSCLARISSTSCAWKLVGVRFLNSYDHRPLRGFVQPGFVASSRREKPRHHLIGENAVPRSGALAAGMKLVGEQLRQIGPNRSRPSPGQAGIGGRD